MNDKERKALVSIDVSNIKSADQLHKILKESLNFPDFYGMNWDAFWDAITGLIEMPEKLKLSGWYNIEKHIPKDAEIMVNLLTELNKKYPSLSCEVTYI
ncbi:MAG: barstar family protein [Candidatus Saccharibacteria bacterium]